MTIKTKFKSDAFEAVCSAAQGLHGAGTIDKATMRDFDEACLVEAAERPVNANTVIRIASSWRGSLPAQARRTALVGPQSDTSVAPQVWWRPMDLAR